MFTKYSKAKTFQMNYKHKEGRAKAAISTRKAFGVNFSTSYTKLDFCRNTIITKSHLFWKCKIKC